MQAAINVGKISNIVIPSIVAIVAAAGVGLQQLEEKHEDKPEVNHTDKIKENAELAKERSRHSAEE